MQSSRSVHSYQHVFRHMPTNRNPRSQSDAVHRVLREEACAAQASPPLREKHNERAPDDSQTQFHLPASPLQSSAANSPTPLPDQSSNNPRPYETKRSASDKAR